MNNKKINTIIAGGVIACVAAVAVVCALIFIIPHNSTSEDDNTSSQPDVITSSQEVITSSTEASESSEPASESDTSKTDRKPYYSVVEDYLKDNYGLEGEIIWSRFQQYDHGITGGLFMYDFMFRCDDGKIVHLHYSSYADISANTLNEHSLTFDKDENESNDSYTDIKIIEEISDK